MSMDLIRRTYGVPAKRGASILFSGIDGGKPVLGVITGSIGQYLRVRIDGKKKAQTLHPTWKINYEEDLKMRGIK